jgi:hypothetical protein
MRLLIARKPKYENNDRSKNITAIYPYAYGIAEGSEGSRPINDTARTMSNHKTPWRNNTIAVPSSAIQSIFFLMFNIAYSFLTTNCSIYLMYTTFKE